MGGGITLPGVWFQGTLPKIVWCLLSKHRFYNPNLSAIWLAQFMASHFYYSYCIFNVERKAIIYIKYSNQNWDNSYKTYVEITIIILYYFVKMWSNSKFSYQYSRLLMVIINGIAKKRKMIKQCIYYSHNVYIIKHFTLKIVYCILYVCFKNLIIQWYIVCTSK